MRDPVASCKGKTGYTKALAQSVAKRMGRASGKVVQAYKCDHCPLWHVGQRTHKRKGTTNDKHIYG